MSLRFQLSFYNLLLVSKILVRSVSNPFIFRWRLESSPDNFLYLKHLSKYNKTESNNNIKIILLLCPHLPRAKEDGLMAPHLPRPFLVIGHYAREQGSAIAAGHRINSSKKGSREVTRMPVGDAVEGAGDSMSCGED